MENLGAQAQIVTQDDVQPHWISQKSRVILENPRAGMLSQDQYGTETPDSANTFNEVQIQGRNDEMQCVWAVFNSSTTSISMSPRLLKPLGISQEVAYITTLGLD